MVEEGIANAIQHGAATEVTVSIAHEQGDIVIRITDNGSGPKAGRVGLGSKLLDELAPGWTLEAQPEGTRLTVRLRPFWPESPSHLSQAWA